MASWLENLFKPSPGFCPAPPLQIPEDITELLPPTPEPEPEPEPPSRANLVAQAAVIAAAISQKLKEENECQTCENCRAVLAGAGGIPPRMPYANTRTSRVGYEYQHYVVNWFHHDAQNRIIMEWQVGGTWFDGLDPKEGTMLASRAIVRSEYDPALTSYCYLIDTKYGYDSWVRYDAYKERWVEEVPPFLIKNLRDEILRQNLAAGALYPNVSIVWIFSGRFFHAYAQRDLIGLAGPQFRSIYYPYIASEDRT